MSLIFILGRNRSGLNESRSRIQDNSKNYYNLTLLGRRESFSVTRNTGLGRNVRSASQDIFHRPNSTNTFWQSMVSMQRYNKWDGNYTPNERSRDRSAPVGLAAIGSSSNN
jgi:hypothetical protein